MLNKPIRWLTATPRRWGPAIGIVVLLWLIGSCQQSATPGTPPSAGIPPSPLPTVTAGPPTPADDQHTIARVIDGDTVVLDDGRHVRMLGIDAPEKATPCGPGATAWLSAHSHLPVTVTPDPTQAVLDRYGRTLAYLVDAQDGDLSVALARAGWAEYYDVGREVQKASEIRAAVHDARSRQVGEWAPNGCLPAPTSPPVIESSVNEPDVPYVPAPETKRHTGHSGHPCLPGERDGDHDGYCGEGR